MSEGGDTGSNEEGTINMSHGSSRLEAEKACRAEDLKDKERANLTPDENKSEKY